MGCKRSPRGLFITHLWCLVTVLSIWNQLITYEQCIFWHLRLRRVYPNPIELQWLSATPYWPYYLHVTVSYYLIHVYGYQLLWLWLGRISHLLMFSVLWRSCFILVSHRWLFYPSASIEIFLITYLGFSDSCSWHIFLIYVGEHAWHWHMSLGRSQGI